MWQAILAQGLVDLAQGIGFLAERKNVLEAKKEAQDLYQLDFADQKKQDRFELDMMRRGTDMSESEMSFSENMFKKQKSATMEDLDYMKKGASTNLFRQSAQNILGLQARGR